MKESLASVIIPAYNMSRYVREAVESAVNQTYPVEVIVVDDGSTDDTRELLEPYISARKIQYIYQYNRGLAGARNTGIRAAAGSYIAFLDADDLFLPTKVERQIQALEDHPDYGVCYSDLLHFTDEPREFFHHRYEYPSGDIFEPLLHRQFINPLVVLARREVFEQYGFFDEAFRRSEDWELWLRFSRVGVKFYYLDEILAYYRIRRGGSLTSIESEPLMKEKNLELFTRLGETLSEEERQRYRFDAVLVKLRRKLVLAYLMVGDKVAAEKAARALSIGWLLLIAALPASVWRFLLSQVRTIKHRLLLKRIEERRKGRKEGSGTLPNG